jgi:hypothetical protein
MNKRPVSTILMILMLIALYRPDVAAAQVTIPKSNKYFAGDITFPDGGKASFEIREGSLLTVKSSTNAARYGLLLLREENSAKLKFMVLMLQSNTGAVSGSLPLQEFALKSPFKVEQSPAITIRVNSMGEKRFPNPPSNIQNQSGYLAEICCHTFSGKEICANFAKSTKGSCRFGTKQP